MTATKERPTFNLIENYEPNVDYEDFKRDFLNPLILKQELREKYSISNRVYGELRDRVLEDTGLKRKPNCTHRTQYIPSKAVESEYIQKVGECYTLNKTIDNISYYFGRYSDYGTAKMVRDRLIESNWDINLGMELRYLYAMRRKKPSLDKAREVYDVFEDRYFNDKSSTIQTIREDLGINGTVYKYCLILLHEKHGQFANRSMYD